MRELLDIPSQRMIRILEILIENEDWTTFAKLGTEINTSERTVAKDIAMLKEKWSQTAKSEYRRHRTCIY